ncbi:MAG: protein kinase domain-containing protein [Ktedonobacterales bacterium]
MVAQGSLCAVYRGQDTVLHRPIAIKAIEPGMVATYRAALQATSTLSHPAIVATYDAIEHDGWLFLIQEYLQARPLTGYLRAGVPSERAVDLGGQLARVLAYAHAHDVTALARSYPGWAGATGISSDRSLGHAMAFRSSAE